MKIMLIFIFLPIIIFSSFSPFQISSDHLDPGTRMAYKLCRDISVQFQKKYDFKFVGISEEGPEGKYKSIGLKFSCKKILSKEEGRELILKCAKEALDIFNAHPEFEEYMDKAPFTYDNIGMTIFVQPSPSIEVYAPNVTTFSLVCKKIWYDRKELINGKIHYSSENESLEEAMKIVEQSNQAKEKNAEESRGDAEKG